MWARIDNGIVVEITDIDPAGRFHSSLHWKEADETVDVGDLYDGEAYSKPQEPLGNIASRKRAAIETARHTAEAQGITHNAIRYAGDPGNRQAIREALEAAADSDMEAFSSWKDSDGQFHANHPVADVWAALRAIAARRSALIEREGKLVGQIDAILADGDLNDAKKREALETIEWSEE